MTCLQTSFVVLVLSKSESLTLPEYAVGFPGGASGKEPACQCGRHKSRGCGRSVRKIPWRRAWQPTPGLLPGESHGQRSLAGYSAEGFRARHDWSHIARTQYTMAFYSPSHFTYCLLHMNFYLSSSPVKILYFLRAQIFFPCEACLSLPQIEVILFSSEHL